MAFAFHNAAAMVVFGHKGILLIFGIFLAYEAESVRLKQVYDAIFVGLSIYNVVAQKETRYGKKVYHTAPGAKIDRDCREVH
ncbi:hypothetical protein RRG08_035168 [Elysia crispata]|uniref:Uncharacterized protein n=1 Tax=Elysia crispata TaxID=231223 RepID=A0AAE1BA35_9GAST|nr:hypothetical protein RRG08_035168 [Elysia crispata]